MAGGSHRYRVGACLLEHVLEVEFGVKMSHNKIHVGEDRGSQSS
ncbi:hypothetical protein [Candidatus Pyrohabitans sp.]